MAVPNTLAAEVKVVTIPSIDVATIVGVDVASMPTVVVAPLTTLPATLLAVSATALGDTTIGTPGNGKYLRKLLISVTESASIASAGEVRITVLLNGVTVHVGSVYVGASASSNAGALYIRDTDFNLISFAAGTGDFVVNLNVALATGTCDINGYFA